MWIKLGAPKVKDGGEKGEKWISWGSLYHGVIVLYLNCGDGYTNLHMW